MVLRRIILAGILIFILRGAYAQTDLKYKTVDGKVFIEHVVLTKENWYSIARKYKVSFAAVKIANPNSGEVLKVGDIVLVPYAKSGPKKEEKNVMSGTNPTKEVKHKVKSKDTLLSISKKYNTTVKQLKKWNQLKSDDLKKGQVLIVGVKTIPQKKETDNHQTVANNLPVLTKDTPSHSADVDTAMANEAAKEMLFINGRKEVRENGIASWLQDDDINPSKYFALHRTAKPGTIIKVINKFNSKSVFVKVIGKLPDTGDNDNLIIKISKSAAEKMGVLDLRFNADLIYGVDASDTTK